MTTSTHCDSFCISFTLLHTACPGFMPYKNPCIFCLERSPFSGHCPRIFSVHVLIYKSSYLPLIHFVLWYQAKKKREKGGQTRSYSSICYLYSLILCRAVSTAAYPNWYWALGSVHFDGSPVHSQGWHT